MTVLTTRLVNVVDRQVLLDVQRIAWEHAQRHHAGTLPRESVDAAIALLTSAEQVAEAAAELAVMAARDAGRRGAGYPALAAAVGITRQAARNRWPDAVEAPRGRRRSQPATAPAPGARSTGLAEDMAAQARVVLDGLPDGMADTILEVLDGLAAEIAGVEDSNVLSHDAHDMLYSLRQAVYGDKARQDKDLPTSRHILLDLLTHRITKLPIGRKLKAHPTGTAVIRLRDMARRHF